MIKTPKKHHPSPLYAYGITLQSFLKKSGIIVAGDERCDSPGHSASYCTYTIMDTETNTVLSTKVVNVAELKNSYNL